MTMNVKLGEVTATVLLAESAEGMRRALELEIENPEGRAAVGVSVRRAGEEPDLPRVELRPGTHRYRVLIPEVAEKTPVRVQLEDDDVSRDLVLKPAKHWEVDLLQVAHFDPGYTDLVKNVLAEYIGFFEDIVRFCDETDDWPEAVKFRFQVEQSWAIVHALRYGSPELAKRLVARMREGRIEVNAFYCNIISELCGHEELIRHLYPAFELKRRYGIPIRVAEHNDIPGISWGLAQAMVAGGIRYFMPALPSYFRWGPTTYRNFWDESVMRPDGVARAFHWEAPDGGKVLMYLHDDRAAGGEHHARLPGLFRYLDELEGRAYPYSCVRYWVQGGLRDNPPPTLDFCQFAREHNNTWAWPRLRVATNSLFFERLEDEMGEDLPVYRGELPGTDYPIGALSQALDTGVNRLTHNSLPAAEAFATVCGRYGYNPKATLAECWEKMLQYDEHAFGLILNFGWGQETTRAEKSVAAHYAASQARDILFKSTHRISEEIRMEDAGLHVVVYNPLSWRRDETVRVAAMPQWGCSAPFFEVTEEADGMPVTFKYASPTLGQEPPRADLELVESGVELVDVETGEVCPVQVHRLQDPEEPSPFAQDRYARGQAEPEFLYELEFTARQIPSVGFRTFHVRKRSGDGERQQELRAQANLLEGPFYRVEFDGDSGRVTSLRDQELDRELLEGSARFGFSELVGRSFVSGEFADAASSRIVAHRAGPVSASVFLKGWGPGCPRWSQEIRIYRDQKRIDVNNRILKDASPLNELYFSFPFDIADPEFHLETGLATLRPIRDQLPGTSTDAAAVQNFVHVGNEEMGVAWCSREAPVVCLSEIWPGYVSQAHHGYKQPGFEHEFLRDPSELRHGHVYSYVLNNNYKTNFHPSQNGDLLFRYSLTSHGGGWDQNRQAVRRFGWEVHHPSEPNWAKGPKEGTLPGVSSFVEVEPSSVVLLALKQAEDGRGVIARLWETAGRETVARVRLNGFGVNRWAECNAMEERGDGAEMQADEDGWVAVTIGANSVGTVRGVA